MKAFKSQQGKKTLLDFYDMLLESMEVPYDKLNIPTRYGNTYLLTAGDKNKMPLLLLHGSSMNSAMWIRDINLYSKYFRVYAPDLPGEPGNSDEEQLPFDTMDYAYWLSDVFDDLNIHKADLVGASLGGWLAAKFAIAYPDTVNKLVLMCPAGIGGQNHEFKDIAMSLLPKGEEGVDQLFRTINGDESIPEVFLNYQKLIGAVFNTRQESIPLFSDEDLQKLVMPSLLIAGGKDIILDSYETEKRFKEFLPDPTIKIIADAGHSLTGFEEEILKFLQK